MKYSLILVLACLFFVSCEKEMIKNEARSEITLDSIFPTSARIGDTVSLFGTGFSFNPEEARIMLGSDSARLVDKTDTSIRFIVQKKFESETTSLHIGDSLIVPGFPLSYRYIAVVSTIAGNGDDYLRDGLGRFASFKCPWGLAIDGNKLYVADNYNHRVRTIDLADPDYNVSSIDPTVAGFYNPYNIAVDTLNHALFVTNFNDKVLKIDAQQVPTVIYTSAELKTSTGIAVGPDKMVYVGDNIGNKLFKIDQNGQNRSEVCPMVLPRRILFDTNGDLYAINGHIMQVLSNGTLKHFEQDVQFNGWEFVVDKNGDFIQADHFTNKIQKVDRETGKVTIIAGSGLAMDKDGIGTEAAFDGPMSIAIDAVGNLYVSTYNFDTRGGNRIRKITFE